MSDELHNLFLRVKKDLMERGWYQGSPGYGPNGEICLGRAITGFFDYTVPYDRKEEVVAQAALAVEAVIGSHIPLWNDAKERTFEEVIDVLDRAIIQTAKVEELV